MKLQPQTSIAAHFAEIEDPRIDRSKDHLLIDILTIAILAVICGADGWVGMETYGKAKYDWLKTLAHVQRKCILLRSHYGLSDYRLTRRTAKPTVA
jgi:hypothetical protein